MNRTYSSQIIIPKIAAPPTRAPLIADDPTGAAADGRRTTTRQQHGAAERAAPRNTDRRDHSICPSDRSKIRNADASD